MNYYKPNQTGYTEEHKGTRDRENESNKNKNLENTTESGYGEMLYIEPNEGYNRRNQMMSPVTEGRQTVGGNTSSRSPTGVGRSVIVSVRNDLNERVDTAQLVGQKAIPTLAVTIPSRGKTDERAEGSPKTINMMGGTEKEADYNIRTVKARRSPQNPVYQTYTITQEQQGNLALDQPMASGSFIHQPEYNTFDKPNDSNLMVTSMIGGQRSVGGVNQSSVMMNMREGKEQVQVIYKMSPNKNMDELNSSGEKYDTQTNLNNLKNQMDRNVHTSGDHTMEGEKTRQMKTDIHHIEDIVKGREGRDISEAEVKRLVKKLTKVYDPRKTTEGDLIRTNQSIIAGTNDEVFNDRYKVLQKMNKLSSILLSKEKQDERVIGPREEERKTFDRNTLTQSALKKDSKLRKTPQHRFLYVSLAMISSKGPNCEDRIILRKMRFEKGGVVDLAQETRKSKRFSVHKISRKAPPTGTKMQRTNPKYRDKAAKVVQGWWRDLRDRYKRILKKIIFIQSFWRGRWMRKYMYDIIYISLLYQSFCQRIQRALVQHVRPYVWDKFFEGKKSALDALAVMFQKDHRFRAIKIRPYWEQWKNFLSHYRNKNLKSKKLVDIRACNDDKLLALLRAFNKWRILTALGKMVNKAKDAEMTQRKFFGMTKIMNGAERLAKRTGLKTVKPHLDMYLANQLQRKAVSLLLGQNPKLKRIVLRNYFNKWKDQVRKGQLKDLRNNIFFGRVGLMGSKMQKNFLRRYLLNWWRKLPKNMEMNYYNGSTILEKAVWRKAFKDPYDALKEKEELNNIKNNIQRLFGVKTRQIKNNWKDYFTKWRSITQKLKDGDIQNRLSYSLLSTMLNKRRNRLMFNRFNHWRKVPRIDLAEIFERFRNQNIFCEKVVRKGLLPIEKDFMDRLAKTVAPKAYKTAIERLVEKYLNNERFFKRFYLNKWLIKCKDIEIYNLNIKLLRAIGGQNDAKDRRNKLGRALRKWYTNAMADGILNKKNDNDRLKERLLQQQMASRLFLNIKKHLGNNSDKDLLRLGLFRWRNKNNLMKKKIEDSIEPGIDHLMKYNIKKNAPDLFKNLAGQSKLNKRTKILRSMPPKYKKGEKFNLLRYFLRWKLRTRDFKNRDLKDLVKKKALFSIFKQDDNEGLIKAWYKWKGLGYQKKNNFPVIVGCETLRKLFIQEPWRTFKKKTDLLNLKIPHNMSLQSAIIRGKSNIAKSLFFRNFALRPYWKKWKLQKDKSANYDIKLSVMRKLLLKDNNQSKIMLRRAFNRWRDVCIQLSKLDLQKAFSGRLLKNMYEKNSKIGLRRAFYQWRQNYRDYIKRLSDAGLGSHRLRRFATKPILNKFKQAILMNDKYSRIKQRLIQAFRGNDLGNLAYCFKRWRDIINKLREMRLKSIVLRNLANAQDAKSEDHWRNRLHEALLRWRINAAPNKTLEHINRIRIGKEILQKALTKPHYPKLLKGLQDKAKNSKSRHALYQLFAKIDPNFDKKLLYKAFYTWKDKVPDTERMKQKLRAMVDRSLVKPVVHNPLVRDPEQDLVEAMHAYDLLKKNKAKPINEFCRALLNIKRQMNILRRNLALKKRLDELDITFKKRYPAAFSKWRRNANLAKANESASTIQNFLKGKMGKNKDRLDRLLKGLKLFEDGVKRKVFKKIKKYSIWQFIKKALLHALNNKKGAANKTLRNYFQRWRDLLPYLRRDDAAKTIQNNYRNLRARNKVNRMRNLNQKMKYLVLKLFGKYLDKRKIAFNKWLLEAQREKCNENAKTIQDFVGKHLNNLKAKMARDKIRKMCRMFVIKKLKDAMIKASKITGDKGAKLYTTLEDIYIRRPFQKLCLAMKWIGRISLLKRIQPKIRRALRLYFLPFYMKRWYTNTVEDRNRKIIQIQRWFRARCLIWRKKAELRKNFLLGKFLRKLTDDADLQLRIPFKLWEKRAKFDKLNNQAINLQKIWRGNTSRKNIDRLLNQNRIRNLLRKGFKNQLADKIRESDRLFAAPMRRNLKAVKGFDQRYATNNVVDFANDALRNSYLYRLTGKRAFTDALSKLRYYFDLWRKNGKKINDAAVKVQSVFRGFIQRKRIGIHQRIKDRLLSIFMRCCRTDAERLAAAFRKWQLRSQLLKCEDNGTIIQDYIIPRLERLLNRKFSRWFIDHAKRLAKHRLNMEGKFKKLRDTLLRMNIRTFKQRLINKDKYDKLRWILLKKFKDLDSDLASLYLKKYFNDWRRNAKLRTKLLNDAALLVQRNFKMYLAKMFIAKLRNKRARMLRLLLKLINDNDLKKQVAFNIWRTNANAMKLDASSRVIQDFLDDIKRKQDNNKKRRLRKRLSDGLDKLGHLKFHLRSAFDAIRSESNRKIFTKFNDDLKKKRDDHVKYAYDKIREREKNFLLNKILRIPNAGRLRLLKKWINRWKDQAYKLGRKQAASMIQKNYRLHAANRKGINVKKSLDHILVTLHLKNEDLLGKYFNKWRSNIKKMTVLKAGNKIGRFVDDKLKDRRAKKNWHKFADNLNLLNKNYAALHLLARLKRYKALDRLYKVLDHRIKRDGYDHLLDQLRKKRLNNKLSLIFNNFEKRKEMLSLEYYFNLWKNKARKLTKRDEALERAVRAMDNRRKIIAADTINKACLIQKLFKTIPKIRALEFFKKLRDYANRNDRMIKFGDVLIQSRDDLIGKNKKNFINKIYKLYTYNILNKFFDRLLKDMMKTKLQMGRKLLDNLKYILEAKSGFNYSNARKSKGLCPTSQFSFKAHVTNPRHTFLNNNPDKFVIPFFVNYLDGKLRGRKKEVMDRLKDNNRANLFCKLYKTHSNNKMIKPKKELYDKMKARSDYLDQLGPAQLMMFKLLRRRWVRHVSYGLREPVRRFRMIYLIKMTRMHKEIARLRFIRELVRKWRFLSFSKRLARKKLELMYKSFHCGYLQMANEVFGEEEGINPSVIKEFERFGAGMGMFVNENPLSIAELQFCKSREVKYQFEATEFSEEYYEESKKDNVIVEENTDYYVDEEIGMGTVGKYQNQSGKKLQQVDPKKKKK